ncbi:hypothetical protein PLICRDRAFT_159510 [Plicaturopsis crispa FD-325 SS-3]|nr:hypothetical protein PLICRDRAFT_159510 [Plicaturopsis crispa FD-325 SS-3]
MPLAVHIKHAGKVHDVQLDTDLPPAAFKDAVYQVTGVPPDRMKVMVKGGVLKDDSDWKKIAPKEGQTFMVIGAAGELPKAPTKPIVFLEDMDDTELAAALAKPVGLKNLGNTCYMNATVQSLRAIPELQEALAASTPTSPLARSLRDLYSNMSKTTESVVPISFLQVLRQVVPQFAEMDRSKGGMGMAGYAQQDAEECWGQMTNALKEVDGIPGPSSAGKKFVEQFMMGEMRRELKCDETTEEQPSVTFEKVLKIECNISITTNFMLSGIKDALDQKVEKHSPSLGRDAVYTQHSRLSRLPGYLTVHMVRFAWRRDINKKAKIMRKVKFPVEFDALDLATDELKAKLLPVSRKLKEVEGARAERRKVRKRTKAVAAAGPSKEQQEKDVEMADAAEAPAIATSGSSTIAADGKGKAPETGELEDESVYREKEAAELQELVSPDLKADVGCSVSGLYDLVAIVTHKGAAADAGHYIGFVKKSVFHATSNKGGASASSSSEPAFNALIDEDDEDWYKFDDDKVSVFPKEKLATLDGGGEDSSAYVLLYRTRPLA